MFIAIEGVDGSGKASQTRLLKKYLENTGKTVKTFAFPRYGEPSAALVELYLQGKLGSEEEVGPYAGSMYYALDRFHASADIRKAISKGYWVICDRFVGSNMAHQGQKITDKTERHKYYSWNMQQEFEIFNLPKPDISLVLTLPPKVAQKFAMKEDKSGSGPDIHEQNIQHLERSAQAYSEICQLFPGMFTEINCSKNNKILSLEEVHKLILGAVI